MSASRDDDIEARLDDLEAHLEDLREELETRRKPPFRPPTPGELLRFTEEYTIPTVVASLEAAVRALELLQRLLRLADPARAAREGGRGVGDRFPTRRDAVQRLDGALADLRSALEEADLPPDESARAIVADAREVTAEIERLLAEDSHEDGAVGVEVTDSTGDEDGPAPTADVESELQSIRDELADDESDSAGEDRTRAESPGAETPGGEPDGEQTADQTRDEGSEEGG